MKTLIITIAAGIVIFVVSEIVSRFKKLGVWDKLALDVASWLGAHGEWEENWDRKSHRCSACQCNAPYDYFGNELDSLYCPYCGARMRSFLYNSNIGKLKKGG